MTTQAPAMPAQEQGGDLEWLGALALCLMAFGFIMVYGEPKTSKLYFISKNLVMPAGNFLFFFYFLASKVLPGLRSYLRDRRVQIQEGVQDFARQSGNIAERFDEVKAKMANVEAETEGIILKAEKHAATEKEAVIASAHKQAERIHESAQALTRFERLQIQQDLRMYLVDKAFARAQELLNEHTNDEDQRRLQSEYLETVSKI